MNLNDWAKQWGVTQQALDDLRNRAVNANHQQSELDYSEAEVQNLVRIEATSLGMVLWRNNVGALIAPNGSQVRYGLANDSKSINKITKSSDLIGIEPLLITHEHVGERIGRFKAREVKKADWTYSGTKQELAQLNYINIVNSLGGDACFCSGKGTL